MKLIQSNVCLLNISLAGLLVSQFSHRITSDILHIFVFTVHWRIGNWKVFLEIYAKIIIWIFLLATNPLISLSVLTHLIIKAIPLERSNILLLRKICSIRLALASNWRWPWFRAIYKSCKYSLSSLYFTLINMFDNKKDLTKHNLNYANLSSIINGDFSTIEGACNTFMKCLLCRYE